VCSTATTLATDVVLKNIAVFGSVNANRRHYYRPAKVLAPADLPSAGHAVPLRKSGPHRLVHFPDGRRNAIAGHAAGPRVTLGWVMTRPQSAATLAAG
jgi:hypothetical protein